MKTSSFSLLYFCLAIISLCGLLGAQTTTRPIVLKGAILIDGTGQPPVKDSVLVIERDEISAAGKSGSVRIPKDADVRDVSGKVIMPTLVALHAHLGLSINGVDSAGGNYSEENVIRQLNKYLAYGVGTVASMGEDGDLVYKLRDEQHEGNLSGARLYTAGRGFAYGPANPVDRRYHPKTADEARADVRELAAHHPDYVKMWVDDDLGHNSKLPPDIYQAIIDEAHRHQLRVFAHVFY